MVPSLIATECPAVSLSLVWKTHQIFFLQDSDGPGNTALWKNWHDIKVILMFGSQYLFNKRLEGPTFREQWCPRCAESNIRCRDITPGNQEPSFFPTGATDWTSIVCLLPRQAALTTASSEARLNLAPRIWQKDASRAGRTQPKYEYTSALPKPRTRTIVVSESKRACPANVFNIWIDQVIRFVGVFAVSRIDARNYLKK